jgi:phosphoglycolate phosphatase
VCRYRGLHRYSFEQRAVESCYGGLLANFKWRTLVARLIAGNKAVECKLVIFDKDGTLVDYRQVDLELAKARRKSIERIMGKEIADFWERAVGIDLKQHKLDYCGPLGTAPAKEELLVAATAFYLKGCAWDEARELAQKAYDEADHLMKSPYGSVMLDGVTAALRKLKSHGLKLAIASTYAHKRTVESLKTLRIASLFDAIVGPEDVANGKPSPDMIFELLRRTGCNTHDAVIVGDSVSDMKMGKNAKLKSCIGVLTGISQQVDLKEHADIIIDSVAQLDAE